MDKNTGYIVGGLLGVVTAAVGYKLLTKKWPKAPIEMQEIKSFP